MHYAKPLRLRHPKLFNDFHKNKQERWFLGDISLISTGSRGFSAMQFSLPFLAQIFSYHYLPIRIHPDSHTFFQLNSLAMAETKWGAPRGHSGIAPLLYLDKIFSLRFLGLCFPCQFFTFFIFTFLQFKPSIFKFCLSGFPNLGIST